MKKKNIFLLIVGLLTLTCELSGQSFVTGPVSGQGNFLRPPSNPSELRTPPALVVELSFPETQFRIHVVNERYFDVIITGMTTDSVESYNRIEFEIHNFMHSIQLVETEGSMSMAAMRICAMLEDHLRVSGYNCSVSGMDIHQHDGVRFRLKGPGFRYKTYTENIVVKQLYTPKP